MNPYLEAVHTNKLIILTLSKLHSVYNRDVEFMLYTLTVIQYIRCLVFQT